MTTRARAFYLLKNRINPILSDFLNSDFIRLFKIRSTALVGSQSDGSRVFKNICTSLFLGPKLLISNVFWNWIWTLNACSADSECRAWRLTLWDFDSAQAVLIKYTEIVTNVTYTQFKKNLYVCFIYLSFFMDFGLNVRHARSVGQN